MSATPPPSPAVPAGRVIGRLAPSPTGHLHLGHARSFLLAWWSARSQGGALVLRIEDLDTERVKPGMLEATIEDLHWLGLDWDGAPVLQSSLAAGHARAIERLIDLDLVYPCVCTRRELAEAASAPNRPAQSPDPGAPTESPYPGTCRGRFTSLAGAQAATGRSAALRFRTPPGPVTFTDLLHGPRSFDVAAEVGDFPVTRRDGTLAYQLAVVVDDAHQTVTEVLRGDDLLSSTARQVLLQRALSLPQPSYLHVPLVEDHTGRRLAKREDPLSLTTLRAQGVTPTQLATWAATSAGLQGPAAPATAWLERFNPAALHRSPTRLPPDPHSLF